jgi:hypothetical protein
MNLHIIYNVIGVSHYYLIQKVSEDYFYKNLLYKLIYFHSSYFIYDSLIELFGKRRWLFIAHHLGAVSQLYILQNSDVNTVDFSYLKKTTELFAWLELSTFIINVRSYLKKEDRLTSINDLFFMMQYGYIRGIVFPFYIYFFLSKDIGCSIIPSLIYIMSMVWLNHWYTCWSRVNIDWSKEDTDLLKSEIEKAFDD